MTIIIMEYTKGFDMALNYKKIVERIWEGYGENLNDWETGFIDNMNNQKSFTVNEQEKILEINRKYRAVR